MSKNSTWREKLLAAKVVFGICMLVGLVVIPAGYGLGWISIETVNMLGRYMTFAIVAVGLDLLWGYAGILSLCQATFFCIGGYAMGIYLAHHGGPEGITDRMGWKIPACLYVVYPYGIGESPEDAMVPWFWKPFFNLPITVMLAVLIPGAAAFLIGVFCFRSRVRGVYFAILTQAIAVAVFLFFQRNEVKFGGTNGLTRFDHVGGAHTITKLGPVNWVANNQFGNKANGWQFGEGGTATFKIGCEFEDVSLGTLSKDLNSSLKGGGEFSTLLNVGVESIDGLSCRLITLNNIGETIDQIELRPITSGRQAESRHGALFTEFRAEFKPKGGASKVRFEVQFAEGRDFTLQAPRLFERYNSQDGGFSLSEPRVQLALYGLTVLSLAGVYLICCYLVRSRFGRVLLAIRDDEPTLRFFGYKPWIYKLVAFVIAAMCAGWGGMLYAPQMKIITPYDMEPARSILVVIWVAVGGRGSLVGAILGALSINLLYDYLTSEHDYGIFVWKAEYWQFVLGGLFVGVVLLFPQGLIRGWDVLKSRLIPVESKNKKEGQ
jgi:ABC-type branched-subunit amino acid transport system permease subunit